MYASRGAVLVLALVALGCSGKSPSPTSSETPAVPAETAPSRTDEELLQGSWTLVAGETGAEKFPQEMLKTRPAPRLYFQDGLLIMTWFEPDQFQEGPYRLDPSPTPKTFDHLIDFKKPGLGLYQLEGDTLRLCMSLSGEVRPASFATRPEDRNLAILTFQRDQPPVRAELDGVRVTITNRGNSSIRTPGLHFAGTSAYMKGLKPGESQSYRIRLKGLQPDPGPTITITISIDDENRNKLELPQSPFDTRTFQGTIHIEVADGKISDVRTKLREGKQ
jgi:uncharacterized protein (TIGR03067 family)